MPNDDIEIEEADEDEEAPCEHLLYHQTQYEPAEYCDEVAVAGTDRCPKHTYDEY